MLKSLHWTAYLYKHGQKIVQYIMPTGAPFTNMD